MPSALPHKLVAGQFVSLEVFAPSGAVSTKGWVVRAGSGVRVELAHEPPFGAEILGTSVQVEYADAFGLYYGQTSLTGLEAGPPAHVTLGDVPELRHVQRREHFRVDAEFPITYTLQTPETPAADQRRAKTSNVSGGGLLFLTDTDALAGGELRERGRVLIDLAIPSAAHIQSEAEIVRTNVVRAVRRQPAAAVAAKFVGLSERERDKLIRYLFQLQRSERLKRGW
jgi:hypothetical protein